MLSTETTSIAFIRNSCKKIWHRLHVIITSSYSIQPLIMQYAGRRSCPGHDVALINITIVEKKGFGMLELTNIDLIADPLAGSYIKAEIVIVRFALQDGELISLEGPNLYEAGDALITGSTGSHWSVSRNRFELKYEPVPPASMGEDGSYQARPIPVLAKQIFEPFTAARSAGGDLLRGNAGDWVLQYSPGDFGIAEQTRFNQVYQPMP